jgi:hypothetical protein
VLPEVWKAEICAGQDAQFVSCVLVDLGMLWTQSAKLQATVRVGSLTLRCTF